MKPRQLAVVVVYFLTGVAIRDHVKASGLPPRIDIGIAMDMSIYEDNSAQDLAFSFIDELLDRVSISTGTGRVAFMRVTNKSRMAFGFRDHVNRECLKKTLRSMRQKDERPLPGTVLAFLKGIDKLQKDMRDYAVSILFTFINRHNHALYEYVKYNKLNIKTEFNGVKVFFISVKRDTWDNETENDDVDPSTIVKQITGFLTKLSLPTELLTTCSNSGSKVFDECFRHCDCIDGKKKNCFRVRKEFTAMTLEERNRYIRTYIKLSSVEPYRTRYDRFIYMHYKYFCWGIHKKNLFFPWHRWYIATMENLLREVDCRVTLPYWDWSHHGADPWNASINSLWNNGSEGLGRNGSIDHGFCVLTGPFRRNKWRPPYYNEPLFIIKETIQLDGLQIGAAEVTPDLANCLRRAMFGFLPTSENVLTAINFFPPEGFADFELYVRHNYHDRIHNQLGGTMCTHYAASAPEFFFHHAFLDKIWFMWQKQSFRHKYAYFVNNTSKMIGSPHSPNQYINSLNMPDCIRVTYTKFPVHKKSERFRRSTDTEKDYIDDNNRVNTSYWEGIIAKSMSGTFPQCGNNVEERAKAVSLFRKIEDEVYKNGSDKKAMR